MSILTTWHYVIGDIHGCYQELLALEHKIKRHAERNGVQPKFISCGDLIDRGPESAAVVAHFMEGAVAGTHLAIMGNHELLMLETLQAYAPHLVPDYPAWLVTFQDYYAAGRGMAPYLSFEDYAQMMRSMWVGQGGFETLKSFDCIPSQPASWNLSPEVTTYLGQLPFYWEHPQAVVTHALAKTDDLVLVKAQSQTYPNNWSDFKVAIDSLIWNRQLPKHSIAPERWHISGHTPRPKARRLLTAQALQIDTGCVYGNRLTAYCIEQARCLSVKSQFQY